ncbi:MAG: amino acid ABC transporter substrate-binding protein [Francisellaceae bacterium]|jgi:arginine/lysine/histidine transporter system substrate-binding protein|nr:amino acid ABC transporter substrate-binding protein [Francisellaceae bacterium]MBT6206797.1 amino acid ABC transporter substrate-binding protein [Francisellaceae bacterium]MBT6539509.1 amino acid ABC transporter substrate-binding protein [Francisellaceae bacterium]
MHIIRNLTISILILLMISCSPNKSNEKLIVGVSPDYPPFEFSRSNKIEGYDIDLVTEIAKQMNKDLEIKDMEFNALIPSLTTNKIDIAISGLTINESRIKNIDFSIPYFKVKLAALSKPNFIIMKIEDLAGKSIGVQTGSSFEQYAKTLNNVTIISQSNNLQLIQELLIGRVDAVFCENSQADEFTKQYNIQQVILDGALDSEYAMAFKKNNEIQEKINSIIKQLKENGFLEQLEAKWVNKNVIT